MCSVSIHSLVQMNTHLFRMHLGDQMPAPYYRGCTHDVHTPITQVRLLTSLCYVRWPFVQKWADCWCNWHLMHRKVPTTWVGSHGIAIIWCSDITKPYYRYTYRLDLRIVKLRHVWFWWFVCGITMRSRGIEWKRHWGLMCGLYTCKSAGALG